MHCVSTRNILCACMHSFVTDCNFKPRHARAHLRLGSFEWGYNSIRFHAHSFIKNLHLLTMHVKCNPYVFVYIVCVCVHWDTMWRWPQRWRGRMIWCESIWYTAGSPAHWSFWTQRSKQTKRKASEWVCAEIFTSSCVQCHAFSRSTGVQDNNELLRNIA